MSGSATDYPIRPTFVPQLDRDHRQLWSYLHRLHLALGSPGQTLRLLQEVMGLAAAHFGREERLFARIAYPDAQRHVREHQDLMTRLQTGMIPLVSRLERDDGNGRAGGAGQMADYEAVLTFMLDWLIWHTNESDQHYAQFLVESGLDPSVIELG